MRRLRLEAVLAAALSRGTDTLAGAVPEGAGSVVSRDLRRRAFVDLPRDAVERVFLGIRYLP